MPTHDIIDNRNQKLVAHINCILDQSEQLNKEVTHRLIEREPILASSEAGLGGEVCGTI